MIRERIRLLREKYSLSQREFGRMIGVTGSYISQIESGKMKTSQDLKSAIVRVFHVNKSWLESGDGPMMMSEGDNLTLGERLKIARTRRGYTQGDLAKAVECNRNSISTAERGLTVPAADLAEKICKALWINESWLRFGIGSMERSELVAEVLGIIRANMDVRSAVRQYMRQRPEKSQDC